MLVNFAKFEYPLIGDGEDHWKTAEKIQDEKSLLEKNVFFPKAPHMYPQGYPSYFVSISNITGMTLQETFILLPVIFYLFYFCSVYFLSKSITKNKIVAAISGLSIFLFWWQNPRYDYIFSRFSFAMPEYLNLFLGLLIISLLINGAIEKKRWFYTCCIIVLSISFIHRTTAIGLFGLIGLFIIFNIIKKRWKTLKKEIILLLTLILGLSIQFVPNLIDYGFPKGYIEPQILSDFSRVSVMQQTQNFFTVDYFNFNIGVTNYLFLMFLIIGLVCLFRKRLINFQNLPYFLLPVFYILNLLVFKINTLNYPIKYFFVPAVYFIFVGLGIYYTFVNINKRIRIVLSIIIILTFIMSVTYIISDIPEINGPSKALQSKEMLGISDGAIVFFESIEENAVIIAKPVTSKTLGIITKKTVLFTYLGHYGMYVHQLYNISQRHEDVREIYESCDLNKTKMLIEKYGEEIYVYIGKREELNYDICYKKFETNFKSKEFENDTIYYLGG